MKSAAAIASLFFLLIVSSFAYAEGNIVPTGSKQGYARECGRIGSGLGPDGLHDEKSAKLERLLFQKKAEMTALLAAPGIDRGKAIKIQNEMNDAAARLAERRLERIIDVKEKNPNWQPDGFYEPYGLMDGGCRRPPCCCF